jgi:hypothetical protein
MNLCTHQTRFRMILCGTVRNTPVYVAVLHIFCTVTFHTFSFVGNTRNTFWMGFYFFSVVGMCMGKWTQFFLVASVGFNWKDIHGCCMPVISLSPAAAQKPVYKFSSALPLENRWQKHWRWRCQGYKKIYFHIPWQWQRSDQSWRLMPFIPLWYSRHNLSLFIFSLGCVHVSFSFCLL